MSEVAHKWQGLIASSEPRYKAEDLYCGRSMREVHLSVESLKADLWIASAGLGLISSGTEIPAYSLTTAGNGLDSIRLKIDRDNWSPSGWWGHVKSMGVGISSLSKLLGKRKQALCLMALPKAYASLMMDDFLGLNPKQRSRIRLFGMSLASVMPAEFHRYIMPYDDRLDGPNSSCPGTRSDFAARALRHFSGLLQEGKAGGTDSADDQKTVRKSLKGWGRPNIPKRTTKTDPEIQALIVTHWQTVSGQSTRMLRYLRDDLQVACEQGRFRQLFNDIAKNQRNLSGRIL